MTATCKRLPQVHCAMCGKPSDKRNGRRRLYCSDACRMAAHRATGPRLTVPMTHWSIRYETLLKPLTDQ